MLIDGIAVQRLPLMLKECEIFGKLLVVVLMDGDGDGDANIDFDNGASSGLL